MLKTSVENIYTLIQPSVKSLPLIFDSPHSGRVYPDDFNHACDMKAMQSAEDNEIDILFERVPHYGATFLCAEFPRTYIDVNRAADDVDLNLFATPLCAEYWQHPVNPSPRSHAGIGLLRRVLTPGTPLYNRMLSHEEAKQRLDQYYTPYHRALKTALDTAHYNFGQVWHINCHSMPSTQRNKRVPVASGLSIFSQQPDFVLGNRDGTTCSADFTRAIRDYLRKQGFRVTINSPYRGVELIRKYSSPTTNRHSIQIEINKALYWDEEQCIRSKNFDTFKDKIEGLTQFLASYVNDQLTSLAAD